MMPEDPFGPVDPMTYIGRITRDANGRTHNIEVFYPQDVISLTDGDEFITFTTVTVLEAK